MAEPAVYLAFDVGGTFVKAGNVAADGCVLPGSLQTYAAGSEEPAERIIANFAAMVDKQAALLDGSEGRVRGLGFAFPGPFDYDRGICYIRGQAKFEQLYGVNVRERLFNALTAKRRDWLDPRFGIVFGNDANLFALGEALIGCGRGYERSMYITIGTGTGAGFVDRGVMLKAREDIPPDAEVFNFPFLDGLVDDYISRRGILALAAEAGFDTSVLDVKEIAALAERGDDRARQVFRRFGERTGAMLVPFIRRFRPEAVIFGGQISKSFPLFREELRRMLASQDADVAAAAAENTQFSVFAGIARLIMEEGKS